MTHVTCRLTAKYRDQLRNATLGNRVWATVSYDYYYTFNGSFDLITTSSQCLVRSISSMLMMMMVTSGQRIPTNGCTAVSTHTPKAVPFPGKYPDRRGIHRSVGRPQPTSATSRSVHPFLQCHATSVTIDGI